MSSILADTSRFGEAVSHVRPNLAVLPAGPPADAANELLERPEFATLVQTAAAQSDLVIVDVPPALPVADPLVATGRRRSICARVRISAAEPARRPSP